MKFWFKKALSRQALWAKRVWRAFSLKHSNSLWQMVIMVSNALQGNYLVTIIDDHSRIVLASRILVNSIPEGVANLLRRG